MSKKKEVKKELKKAPKKESKKDVKKEAKKDVKVVAKKVAKVASKKELEKTTTKKIVATAKDQAKEKKDIKKKPIEAKGKKAEVEKETPKKTKKEEKLIEAKKEVSKKEAKKPDAAPEKPSKKSKEGKPKTAKERAKDSEGEVEAKGGEVAAEDEEEGTSSKPSENDDDFFGDDDSEFGGEGDFGPKFEFEEEIEKELAKPRKRDKGYDDFKEAISDEVIALAEDFPLKDIIETLKNVNFFSAKTDECLEKGCDNPATTLAYCRYHYITNWKDVKKKQTILKEGKLQEFIEDLVKKYPAKYLENIITDLNDEKSFLGVLKEMDIDADDDDAFDDVEEDVVEDEQDIAFETRPVKIQYTEE
ncbi:MAG: hypothetical protein HYV97_16060 [Bdellovibrio sp.]|nr:hypothetical protein [Bdellovibrio sp.]